MTKLLAHIEIPRYSTSKFEYDKELGVFILDREIIHPYPENYGYIPNTLSEDGDPLDVFVISRSELPQNTYVRIVPLHVIYLKDGGKEDNKIIATTAGRDALGDTMTTNAIIKFTQTYKSGVEFNGVGDMREAIIMIKNAQGVYEKAKG